MKKKITICLALVLTVALAISVLTACSLFGGDNKTNNNNNQNGNEPKTLTSSECSSELSSAINTSLKKSNYTIKILGNEPEGISYVTNIEHDANTLHYIYNWTKDYLGENNKLYIESYYFVNDGNYYSSVRDSESEDFRTSTTLKATFDTYVASRSLKTFIDDYKLDDNAEITYEGTKKGTESSITATTVATINGVKTQKFTSFTIKNGLIVSMVQRVSVYEDDDSLTNKSEKDFTFKYDTATVELAAGISIA